MDYRIAESKIDRLEKQRNIVILVSVILLCSNLLLTVLIKNVWHDHTTIIVPANLSAPVAVSNKNIDTNYLRQMALFFMSLRLNIEPNTIDAAHHTLMGYVDPKNYAHFKSDFSKETFVVKKEHISSVFYPSAITPNLSKMQVTIQGQLHRWAGKMDLGIHQKTFLLTFHYDDSRLHLTSFSEIKEPSNVSS